MRNTASTDRLDALMALVREQGAMLAEQGATLQQLKEMLTARRGPRDGADTALIKAIAREFRDQWFTAASLLKRARTSAALASAVLNCDLDSSSSIAIGRWLQRMAGVTIARLRLVGDYDKHRRVNRWRLDRECA